jgi:hypothetical protein
MQDFQEFGKKKKRLINRSPFRMNQFCRADVAALALHKVVSGAGDAGADIKRSLELRHFGFEARDSAQFRSFIDQEKCATVGSAIRKSYNAFCPLIFTRAHSRESGGRLSGRPVLE